MMANEEKNQFTFTLLDLYERIVQYWWVLGLISILGAGIGFAISFFIPPTYESRFIAGIGIDNRITGQLTDFSLDQVLTSAGDIFTSPVVIDGVVSNARRQGIEISVLEIGKVLYKERQFNHWILRVQHDDPEMAKKLADIWLEEAVIQFDEALTHAVKASLYAEQSQILMNCLQEVTTNPVHAYCNLENMDLILGDLDTLALKLLEERNGSKGLLSGVSYSIVEKPVLPSEPEQNGRSWMMLSGTGVGFILSLLGISLFRVQLGSTE